ncbi:acyl-CoA N-acyltransferase [Neohortaea acidophila]|uniref:Acyl-CoA N-acyltransferase n=1 Tax=Neohortaea acidophila TaxID=245834 RepID=A0A6A6PZV2_9PEZI|nr:acyl-CoA N-acyltransferase [Neohortaea acidophila]KAF2485738.1 acyl-CoA N-acyltransferase [Neohortaea acidophila]
MAHPARSEFVDLILPLHDRLKLYDRTKPPYDQPTNDATDPARAVPESFIDAMRVRHSVYVEEQGVPIERELDDSDPRSFHWVAYASVYKKRASTDGDAEEEKLDHNKRRKSSSTKMPIGTIRIVPPPHPPHPNGKEDTAVQSSNESFIELGELAVIPEYRKVGISKLLIETALAFVRDHLDDILPRYDPKVTESMRYHGTMAKEFKGLVLVHAQIGVQKVWRRFGFETDESMGTWDEEGREHVGMWKRVDVKKGRRESKIVLDGTL